MIKALLMFLCIVIATDDQGEKTTSCNEDHIFHHLANGSALLLLALPLASAATYKYQTDEKQKKNGTEYAWNKRYDGECHGSSNSAEMLLERYGVLDEEGRYKMLLFYEKKAIQNEIATYEEDLMNAAQQVMPTIPKGPITFRKLCRYLAKHISEDDWMCFARLNLNLTREEIRHFRQKHCIFTEEQMLQIQAEAYANVVY